jgi:hypothetical protein
MLAKRIDRDPEKAKYDNFRALALYVAGYTEKKPEEKILHSWIAGCGADNFLGALIEIECVQAINTRSKGDKSYHLMLSFRPEDEDKLTPERMEDIEKKIALALGFETHQRICGIHHNTSHIHMHIAYNKINQENFTIRDPYRDFYALAKVCREIEQEYGLVVDPGLEPGRQEPTRTNVKVQTVEARTGQQSFHSYLRERREALLQSLEHARNWADLHSALGKIGVVVALRGNGCIFKDVHGKHAATGSSLAREFSLPQLEKRFGSFQAANKDEIQAEEHYTAKPLRGHERGELFMEYQRGIDERKAVLEALADERKKSAASIKKKWQLQREKIQASNQYLRNDKYWLISQTRVQEQTELAGALETQEKKKKALREKVPYTSWLEFLQYKAKDHGSELALEILRGKDPERGELLAEYQKSVQHKQTPYTNWEEFLQYKANQGSELALEVLRKKETAQSVNETAHAKKSIAWKTRLAEIAADTGLIRKDKRVLTAVTKMLELQDSGLAGTEGLSHSIDLQGVIIFKLRSGGQVRDDGKTISYSAFDPDAKRIAAKYAATRFGKFRIDGNTLTAARRENEQAIYQR